MPLRTGLGCALLALALTLVLAGSDDVQARYLHVSVFSILHVYQFLCFAAPLAAFAIAYAAARDLRARGGVREADRVRLRRTADGGFDGDRVP